MPDGTLPTPGGWNRFSIEVADLAGTVDRLHHAGVHLRSDPISGVGGKQVVIDDPSGNPVELFEPTRPEARLGDRQHYSGPTTGYHHWDSGRAARARAPWPPPGCGWPPPACRTRG